MDQLFAEDKQACRKKPASDGNPQGHGMTGGKQIEQMARAGQGRAGGVVGVEGGSCNDIDEKERRR
jgi:hypothetical protein